MARRARLFVFDDHDSKAESIPLLPSQKIILKNTIAYLEIHSIFDDKIRKRNLLLLANDILSLVLMVLVLELEWNQDTRELVETTQTFYLKILLAALTFLRICQITNYYHNLVEYEMHYTREEKRRKEKISPRQSIAESRAVKKPLLLKKSFWTVINSTPLVKKYFMEILISIPFPFPFANIATSKLGLWMFIRLYSFFKVCRDFSAIYKKRKTIERLPEYHGTHPTFNTFLSMKMFFYQYPAQFLTVLIVSTTLILGYSVYVFEREDHHSGFTFFSSLYVVWTSIVTGWATDTYDVYNPNTWGARLFCISGVVVGLFLFAMLIDYIHIRMRATNFQETALNWVIKTELEEKEKDVAARLIQLLWRQYKWTKVKRDFTKKIRRAQKSSFTLQFAQQIQIFQQLRKELKKQRLRSSITLEDQNVMLRDYVDRKVDQLEKRLLGEISKLLEKQKQDLLSLQTPKAEME